MTLDPDSRPRVAIRRLRLGPELLHLSRVVRVNHERVAGRSAHVRVGLEERLVPAFEHVDLGKVERRVVVAVQDSVLVPQEAGPVKDRVKKTKLKSAKYDI